MIYLTILIMNEYITIILASSVIATVLSTIINYFISIRLKRLDYKNEYYKTIIKKRLEVYRYIETQLAVLNGVVLNDDKRNFHMIFSEGADKVISYQRNLFMAMSDSLWIDEATGEALQQLNFLFYNINVKIENKNKNEVIEIGKDYYSRLAEKRKTLRLATKNGYSKLHLVDTFFKEKNKAELKKIYKE